MTRRLGKSQKAVLDWLRIKEYPVTAREVGAALYDTTSFYGGKSLTRAGVKTAWAKRILQALCARGLVGCACGLYQVAPADDLNND